MFNVEVDDRSIQLKLGNLPRKLQERLTQSMIYLTQLLRNYIITDKLTGGVLNRRTGDLARSIQDKVDSSVSAVVGTVYSTGHAAIYGKIHEYGAIFQKYVHMAWGREMKDPRSVTFHYPERSFMRSGLRDMRGQILNNLQMAVKDGTQ